MVGVSVGKDATEGDVILLFGDYGVGKTEFVRGVVCGYLGQAASQQVASPSFALLHIYDNHVSRVCHYDFYRLTAEQKACPENLFQEVEDQDLICIEWAEGLQLPQSRQIVKVHISMVSLDSREIYIEKVITN